MPPYSLTIEEIIFQAEDYARNIGIYLLWLDTTKNYDFANIPSDKQIQFIENVNNARYERMKELTQKPEEEIYNWGQWPTTEDVQLKEFVPILTQLAKKHAQEKFTEETGLFPYASRQFIYYMWPQNLKFLPYGYNVLDVSNGQRKIDLTPFNKEVRR